MPLAQTPSTHSFGRQARRFITIAVVCTFTVAAIAGVWALFADTESTLASNVLVTTLLVGTFSIAALCGASVFGRHGEIFGWVTVATGLLTLIYLLTLVWGATFSEEILKFAITGIVLTTASAAASLLMLTVTNSNRVVRVALYCTLMLIGFGAILILVPVWEPGVLNSSPNSYLRITGVTLIFATLGAVVTPVLALVLKLTQRDAPADLPAATTTTTTTTTEPATVPREFLSGESTRLLESAARDTGMTPDELVTHLLRQHAGQNE